MGRPLLLAGLFFSLSPVTSHPLPAWAEESSVRLELFPAIASLRVSVPIAGVIRAAGAAPYAFEALRWQEVRSHPNGLAVGSRVFRADQLSIVPGELTTVFVNGARHRGALTIRRTGAQQLQVVNVLPLEEYVKGVVPSEVDARWPMETLKAQAILARTMTLRQLADRAAHPYDVTRTWPQLYGGILAERGRAAQAVEATRGLVLTHEGRLLPAYYHTICGGMTEDGPAVFPAATQAPLRRVACASCRRAPHYQWRVSVRPGEWDQRMRRHAIRVGPVTGIVLGAPNASGRVTTVTIEGPQGRETLSATRFRAMLGPNRLRSTRFQVRRIGSDWMFEGQGWGHGVGLCQWGAAGLGQRQQTAEQVLAFYYPGAEIRPMESLSVKREEF